VTSLPMEPRVEKATVESMGESSPEISVVVPVAERPWALDRLYREYAPALEATGEMFEFLFVLKPWAGDLASPLADLIRDGAPIRVLETGFQAGESEMLAAAAEVCKGSVILTLPPYPRILPDAIPELLQRVRSGLDVATARRLLTESSWLNRIQNRAFHTLLRWWVGGDFKDVACGVRAMRKDAIRDIPLYGDSYRFLPLLARREGLFVEEVSTKQHPMDGKTRVYSPGIYLRRFLDLLGLVVLVRFTQKPLRFFGFLGSVFGLSGSVILVVLFFQRLGGQDLADRPLLLLGILLFSLGVQAIAIGLVGEIIVHFGASARRLYRVAEVVPSAERTGERDEG